MKRPVLSWSRIVIAGWLGAVVSATAARAASEYREYPSRSDSALRLFARFTRPARPGILLVKMHGWHGAVKTASRDDLDGAKSAGGRFFVVEPEMRGRGDATGNPDCNGCELQDVVDAVEFAKARYAADIAQPDVVLLSGGSGGGGNAYGLVGKFPDYFAAAVISSGMSDYALWHHFDRKGEFRDEMDGRKWLHKNPNKWQPWIGPTPEEDPEAYDSRSGLTTVRNLLTPALVFHGERDLRVPALHARLWVGAADGAGKRGLVEYHEFAGVGGQGHMQNETPEQQRFRAERTNAFLAREWRKPELPARGSLVIGGYVKTARFEVILDAIGRVGRVDYDLAADTFRVSAMSAKTATLRVKQSDGTWRTSQVECELMKLPR